MIISFRKPKIKLVLQKYNKLLESEVYKSVKDTENRLTKMFDEESINCKWCEEPKIEPYLERKCNHKKGIGICEIFICPLR